MFGPSYKTPSVAPLFDNPDTNYYQPGYGLWHGQNGNIPFEYDPFTETYVGYRWDVDDNQGHVHGPLTQETVSKIQFLNLSSHPVFFDSPWINGQARLTKVWFKEPKMMILNDQSEVLNFQYNGTFKEPTKISLKPIGHHYVGMGFNGFYSNLPHLAPVLTLVNPVELVTGAVWYDFAQGELQALTSALKTKNVLGKDDAEYNNELMKAFAEIFCGVTDLGGLLMKSI